MPADTNDATRIGGSPTTTIAVVLAILVTGAITALAVWHRSGGVDFELSSGNYKAAFKVAENRIDLNQLLDCLLSEQLPKECSTLLGPSGANDRPRREAITGILQGHGFYRIPSDRAATALRDLKESENTQPFIQSMRQLLYDLAGPFARPATFMDASDDRLLLALDDLVANKPSSPLVARLWEMSLDWKGIFQPRIVKVDIQLDTSLKEHVAATCAGSVLLEKSAQVVANEQGDIGVSVIISKARPCAATSTENLLAGTPAPIWMSETDIAALLKDSATANQKSFKGILVPAPNNFTPRD